MTNRQHLNESPASVPGLSRRAKLLGLAGAAAVVLAVLLALFLPGLGGSAAGRYLPAAIPLVTSGVWSYVPEGDGVTIVGYEGTQTLLSVPDTLDGKPVRAIGSNAFEGHHVDGVFLPEGITAIRRNAFAYCHFSSITLPASLETLEELAFNGCSQLDSIRIPYGVKNVTGNPFTGCTSLSTILAAPDHPCLALMNGALYSKADRRLICLLPSAEASQNDTFSVPEGVTSIGSYAFSGCRTLVEIVLPDSVTRIGEGAFESCEGLERIAMGSSLRELGSNAFTTCTALSEISLPDTLEAIGDAAFSWCTSLQAITIPSRVTVMGSNPFHGCSPGLQVRLSDGNPALSFTDGALYHKGDSRLIYYPAGIGAETFNVAPGTRIIGARAFSGASSLKEVGLPAGLREIGSRAFSGLTALEGVDLPEGLILIGDCAFEGCTSLESAVIPGSVACLGAGAYSDCSALRELVLNNGLMVIRENAFADCPLDHVDLPISVECVGIGAFGSGVHLTIPHGSRARQYLETLGMDYAVADLPETSWLR